MVLAVTYRVVQKDLTVEKKLKKILPKGERKTASTKLLRSIVKI